MEKTPFFNNGPVRWGIIGCGNVTEVKSGPPYYLTNNFELVMVMRRNAKKAKDFAKRHGIPAWTTDAAQLIESSNVDAVYIATPPDTHKYYGLMVAKAGKPCCIEKPMAPNYADSLAIYEAFKERQLPLFIAYYRRSLPRFLKLKEWIDEGKIGELRHLNWIKTRTPSPLDQSSSDNWRTNAHIAKGGYFDDLASHGLNLFSFLLGDIIKASGVCTNQQGWYSSYDSISGCWMHSSGVTGAATWNFGSNRPIDKVELFGSKGEIHFSVLGEAPLLLITDQGSQSLSIDHPKHLHQYHVENIQKHLFGVAQHPSLGDSGLATSWVMDSILGVL